LGEELQLLAEDPSIAEQWTESQDAWVSTMGAWQKLELLQIGSLASSLDSDQGRDLRDEIYSWPTVNPCRIDQETVLETWMETDFFSISLVNIYGLDSLEYLLFAPVETVCPSQVSPVSDGTWDDLGEQGVLRNRAKYAVSLHQNITENLHRLSEEWSSEDWQDSATDIEWFQNTFNALFYLESKIKDRKLAQPLGIKDCSKERCLDEEEGVYSDLSLLWIQQNLQGFELLFTMNNGVGFDDLLRSLGYEDLATSLLEELEKAKDMVAHLSERNTDSLVQAIEAEPEKIEELIESLSTISSLLRVDISTILELEIPTEVAGDND